MTPTVASLMRRIAERRLAEIDAERAELQAALRELGGSNGAVAQTAATNAPQSEPVVEAPSASPQEMRRRELMVEHGTVAVVTPPVSVKIGQQIRLGVRQVEIIEACELANEKGDCPPGRYYAKQVE